jgi:hypothetical protein
MRTLPAVQRSVHSAQRGTSHHQVFISLPILFPEEPFSLNILKSHQAIFEGKYLAMIAS